MSTLDDLKTAFAGESQANRKYLAYGEQADKDGFSQVAKLFRATAAAETIHAHAHLRAMDGVKTTEENLVDAVAGENYEVNEMYPPFLAGAEAEGHKKAMRSFGQALDVEKVHAVLYGDALESIKAGKDLPEAAVHVCDVCGHTVIGEAPDRCPVCGAKHDHYSEIK